ncbi:hypothetical protein [Pedobacter agri]|uniref:hypothetical protein n=1 Tax=Pedobacter agri TaxID=454586 RepID=UPI00292DB51A|nr:hypothetical protein [Pedobacter agri]
MRGKISIPIQLKHLYIMHRLNYVSIFRKDEYLMGVPMNTELLTMLFGKGSDVKNVLKTLERFKFIVKVRDAKLNEYSASYKLHESIANDKVNHHDFCASDSALMKKIKEHNDEIKSFTGQLEMLNKYISLNELGKSYLEKKYGILSNEVDFFVEPSDIGIKAIYSGHYYSKRPDVKSRVYTNLTSLPREHRKYVNINGKPMLMTDISNSQILLTVPLLHKYWAKISGVGLFNLPEDVRIFQRLAESGMFYETIAASVGVNFLNSDERGEFKKKVFAEVWFSKNSNRMTAIKKAFKKEFPNVFDIICKLKEKKHNEFAIKLQKFEASILVDTVWKTMYKLGKIVFTLHDAIICNNEEDLFFAERLIESELLKFGLVPKFKREDEEIYQLAA